jgi:hypothetical protein
MVPPSPPPLPPPVAQGNAVLLSLAFGLATLSLFLGFILRTLPYRRYRNAGNELIEDGYISFALIAMINGVVAVSSLIGFFLYGDASTATAYQGYYAYVTGTKNGALAIIAAIGGVLWALGMANVGVGIVAPGVQPFLPLSLTFQSQIGPWLSMVQATYSLMVMLESVGHILQERLLVLVAFGCVLYAVPKRLTRAAGGAMIAWPLVFYFGLPFMPIFVNMYGSATYHEMACTLTSCPAFDSLNPLSGNWQTIMSGLLNFGALISEDAASLIWTNFFLPLLWIGILSLAAAGVGRVLGGYVSIIERVL